MSAEALKNPPESLYPNPGTQDGSLALEELWLWQEPPSLEVFGASLWLGHVSAVFEAIISCLGSVDIGSCVVKYV